MNRPEGISESAWEAAKKPGLMVLAGEGFSAIEAMERVEFAARCTIARAIQSAVEAERARLEALLRDPAAVRVNYLRGGIACQHLIDEAIAVENERCAQIVELATEQGGGSTHLSYAGPDIAATIRKGA